MTEKLCIILFDGSFKTTPFINRLAAGLAEKHLVYILAFSENMVAPVPNVRYIALGSNQDKIRFVKTAFYWAWKQKSFKVFLEIFRALLKGDRKRIQKLNFKTALTQIQPDIIHLQWTSVIPVFQEVLQAQNIPVILSQRGFHTNVKPFVYNKNMDYLRQWYPYFAGFHSVSKAITKNGDKIWRSLNKIDEVVYTGLPLEEWLFNTNFKETKVTQLISVGRSHWKKGYDYSLQVCSILKANDVPFHYTIIGGAEKEELQFLINDLGLQEYVSLLGRMSLEEVKKRMRESSLMLLPSLEEGLPNVAVEAMAIGLPVVAFDVDGLPELIESDKEGLLVSVRNVKAMAEAVVNFIEMGAEGREKIRQSARRKVERQHHEEMMVEGMENLYRKIKASFSSAAVNK